MVSPKLSVCLLVYNSLTVGKTIDSILNQSYNDFELIMSDDNSTNDTYQVCKNYSERDKRIKVIKTPYNIGMAGNTNYAISNANGKWVALLHHDDILNFDCLDKWMNVAESLEHIAFVFNDYFEKKNAKDERIRKKFTKIINGRDFLKNTLLKYWSCPARGTALIRKKYFDVIGGMDSRFGLLADVDLWMRLASRWNVGYIHEPLIKVGEKKPSDYPKEYKDFSWKRWIILFDIHAVNIKRVYGEKNLYHWFKFRVKVSYEIIKWLMYGVIRKKEKIIKDANEGVNDYEFFFVKIFRSFLLNIYRI